MNDKIYSQFGWYEQQQLLPHDVWCEEVLNA